MLRSTFPAIKDFLFFLYSELFRNYINNEIILRNYKLITKPIRTPCSINHVLTAGLGNGPGDPGIQNPGFFRPGEKFNFESGTRPEFEIKPEKSGLSPEPGLEPEFSNSQPGYPALCCALIDSTVLG